MSQLLSSQRNDERPELKRCVVTSRQAAVGPSAGTISYTSPPPAQPSVAGLNLHVVRPGSCGTCLKTLSSLYPAPKVLTDAFAPQERIQTALVGPWHSLLGLIEQPWLLATFHYCVERWAQGLIALQPKLRTILLLKETWTKPLEKDLSMGL